MRPNKIKSKKTAIAGKIVSYFILTVASILFILPFLSMIGTAFKTVDEIFATPPTLFPLAPTFENFKNGLFTFQPYFKYFFNTLFLAVVGTAATVVTSTMVGYGFARFKVKENGALFVVVLCTMMLPAQVTMISSYIIWAELQLVNTYVPLLIGCFFGGSAFYIFLSKQFISGLPIEYEEAAQIDGASRPFIFIRIIFPLLLPLTISLTIFSFQGIWNDYMGPLIYIKNEKLYTLSIALTQYLMEQEKLWGELMAASLVTMVPIVIFFVIFQRYFISGITIGGVKG